MVTGAIWGEDREEEGVVWFQGRAGTQSGSLLSEGARSSTDEPSSFIFSLTTNRKSPVMRR